MTTKRFPNTEARSSDIRIVTMNLWGRRGAWVDRRSVIRDGLHALQPDLVAFQESIKNDEYDQVIDLLGPEFHIAHQAGREPDGQGISVASRWPVKDVQEVDLNVTPRTADFACTTLVAEILVPPPIGSLLFVNHLPNWQLNFEYERELQAVTTAQFLEERVSLSNSHVVMAGDFDADPDSASVRFWSGLQSLGGMSVCYRDAWVSTHLSYLGHTFTPRNPLVADWDWPFRRIDYIFVRCGDHGGPTLEVNACTRLFDEPVNGVWASDHFGLAADLSMPTCSSTLLS